MENQTKPNTWLGSRKKSKLKACSMQGIIYKFHSLHGTGMSNIKTDLKMINSFGRLATSSEDYFQLC